MIREPEEARFTILLIEHKLDLVMQLSDRVVVMDDGQKIAEGLPAEVRRDPAGDRGLSRPSREVGAPRAQEAARMTRAR